jgi:hypothetical protein
VTALEGHQPNTPGGFPFSSDKRQYSDLSSACIGKYKFHITHAGKNASAKGQTTIMQ